MWTLAIDTAGVSGSIALGNGDAVFVAELERRSYSAQVVATADSLFRQAGTSLSALTYLAVVTGPGSFTGIRVGLSIAKAWAEASDVKLITISRLALCAACIAERAEVRVALDAGRGEFFVGDYRAHGEEVVRESLIKLESLLAGQVVEAPLFVFEASAAEVLAALHPVRREPPSAVDTLHLAARFAAAGDFADPLTLDANYLRRSDAELFSRQASREKRRN